MDALLENVNRTGSSAAIEKARGKILIVDDEPRMRELIEACLRKEGYDQFVFSSSGSVVPTLALKEQPQLIIMDVMMAGGNGMRALRTLKSSPVTAGIPVIMTSGFTVQSSEPCAQNQADGFLPKPFGPVQLLAIVERLLTAVE